MPFDEARKFLEEGDDYLLSTHVNPDGDGLGSMLGVGWLLDRLGKKYRMVIDGELPRRFRFLRGYDAIETYNGTLGSPDKMKRAVIVDSPSLERIGKSAKLLDGDGAILNIDHHASTQKYAQVNLIEENSSSTTEVVYRLIKKFDFPIDRDLAEYIYSGLCIDTGRFRFSNTTASSFRTASELVEAGARPEIVAQEIYFNESLETRHGLGVMLGNIKMHSGGKITSSYLDYNYLSGAEGSKIDTEGYVNYVLSIRGVEAAILLQEEKENFFRVSLRSRTDAIDVNEIAKVFNGGGHRKASGCKLTGSLDEARGKLINEIEKYLP